MPTQSLSVVGLFAGIGGVEEGLRQAGHHSKMLCEIDEGASNVLKAQFQDVDLKRDVRKVTSTPRVDLIAAGFPCQDLSQAGLTAGIRGTRSGLVGEVFRIVRKAKPNWLLLENVPFMLSLDRGAAMKFLADEIESLGYRWAYRVVDSRSFGLPQRRRRVLFLASRHDDPSAILFTDEAGEPPAQKDGAVAHGFYWTEGNRGLGWAVDAIPTLKGGSTIGIPSPPAIWLTNGSIVTPEIRDAERLQGFAEEWTAPWSTESARLGPRWKMVGNAVSVPVARWLGERLARGGEPVKEKKPLPATGVWPTAAMGGGADGRFEVERSEWPLSTYGRGLENFLKHDGKPLSAKATSGFLTRLMASSLHREKPFEAALRAHLRKMENAQISRPS
jgi:DNA (cytosine-5)-methyltransferase 1